MLHSRCDDDVGTLYTNFVSNTLQQCFKCLMLLLIAIPLILNIDKKLFIYLMHNFCHLDLAMERTDILTSATIFMDKILRL